MPTDRSLNRVKKISRSRFGQQTLHKPKKKSHCSLQEKTQLTQTNQSRLAQGGGTPGARLLVPRTAAKSSAKVSAGASCWLISRKN
jgi:hypothetical protein